MKGDTIIKEGDQGSEFFLLESGSCEVSTTVEGETKVLNHIEKGGYCGEVALLENGKRSATVVAHEDCTFVTIDSNAFKRLLGPLTKILYRNAESYARYTKN